MTPETWHYVRTHLDTPKSWQKCQILKDSKTLNSCWIKGSVSIWTWLSNVLMPNISAIFRVVSDTCQVSWFPIKFSSIQIGHSLANSSLEMPASSVSEMTHVQFPLPACAAVLLRFSSSAVTIHNEPSFCLLIHVLHVRPWITGYIRPCPEFSFMMLLQFKPMSQTFSLKEALPVQQVNISVQWEDTSVCKKGLYWWIKLLLDKNGKRKQEPTTLVL